MSTRIEFDNQGWKTNMDYADVCREHCSALEREGVYEIVLADGVYGSAGVEMRLLINPHKVASIGDLDGKTTYD